MKFKCPDCGHPAGEQVLEGVTLECVFREFYAEKNGLIEYDTTDINPHGGVFEHVQCCMCGRKVSYEELLAMKDKVKKPKTLTLTIEVPADNEMSEADIISNVNEVLEYGGLAAKKKE